MPNDLSESEAQRLIAAFLNPADRSKATHGLASHGGNAVAVLRSIFDGTAKNQFGVSYSSLGMPIDCALVVISLLGPVAAPLEEFVCQQLRVGHPYAEDALKALKRGR